MTITPSSALAAPPFPPSNRSRFDRRGKEARESLEFPNAGVGCVGAGRPDSMAESRARHLSRFDWKFNSAVKAAGVTPVLSCKIARQVSDIVPQFIVRGDFADQSPRRRLARANTAAGDQHFQRRTAPNQPRQSLRSAPTGDDPPSDARMRE